MKQKIVLTLISLCLIFNFNEGSFWIFYLVLLALMGLMYLIYINGDFRNNTDVYTILFISICFIEIVYYFGFNIPGVKYLFSLSHHDSPLWFCDFRESFLWGVVNSLTFYLLVLYQTRAGIEFFKDRYDNNKVYNCDIGIWAAIVFVFIYGLTEWLVKAEKLRLILVIIFLLSQAFQIILFLKKSNYHKSAIPECLIYLVTVTGTVLLYSQIPSWIGFITK